MVQNNYQPPGVYVEDASVPYADPINPVFGEHLPCIIAPALGYQSAQETVVLSSVTAASLSHTGVNQDTTFVVQTLGGVVLTLNTDYAVSVDSSVPSAPVTSIKRLPADTSTTSPNGVAEGDAVVVSYTYTDDAYWQPTTLSSFSDVTAKYGPPLTDQVGGSQVLSPLSLAVQAAMENGASQVICVAVQGNSNVSWQKAYQQAYDLILTNTNVSTLTPIFPSSLSSNAMVFRSLLMDLRGHVMKAYSEGNGRMAVVGAGAGFDESANPFSTVATSVANKRVSLVYPTRAQVFNSNTSQVIEVDGAYLGAAIAGRLVMNPVDRGVTRQVLNTVTGIPPAIVQKMTSSFMNSLSSNGVCVCMVGKSGRVTVRHGLTTDMSSLFTREISLVRIGDTLLQDIQQGMESSGLIGSPITADTIVQVKSALMNCLEQEVGNQTIITYANVSVSQEQAPGGDPSIIDCSFVYKPAAPLNYIDVSFSLDMNIGTISTATGDTTNQDNLSSPNSSNSTVSTTTN